jgi:hypothetical protein
VRGPTFVTLASSWLFRFPSQCQQWCVPAAAVEATATGLILIVGPSLFAWLILNAELSASGQALGRFTGIALIGAGLVHADGDKPAIIGGAGAADMQSAH